MSEVVLAEQLEQAIEGFLHEPGAKHTTGENVGGSELRSLLRLVLALTELPREAFRNRLKEELAKEVSKMTNAATKSDAKFEQKGFRAVTPYLTVRDVHEMIAFVQAAFGAKGKIYGIGSAGGYHSEYQIGDSMVMIGGGGKGAKWQGTPGASALHFYVKDVDAIYERAIKAGASSLMAPTDQPYGDREAAISDVAGNHWYIATHKGENYIPDQANDLMPFLHPQSASKLIAFLKDAFGAEEVGVHESPDGIIQHATVRIVDSMVEMGEAHGEWQPMRMSFMLYVDDVDEWYRRAAKAKGAVVVSEPSDQGYGRVGTIKDPFENTWYIATKPASAET